MTGDYRLRHARGFMRELIRLCEEQRWTFREKGAGFLFMPPAAIRRPGYEQIFAVDPGTDSYVIRNLRKRFQQAGLKFPDDQQEPAMQPPKPVPLRVPPDSVIIGGRPPGEPIAEARRRLTALGDHVVNELSAIGGLLDQHEQSTKKLSDLRNLLKGALE